MGLFRDESISTRLRVVTMSTSLFSILLVAAGFLAYEYFTFRNILVKDLSTKADLVGQNCTAAILFANREDVLQTLQALESQPHIRLGAVYAQTGEPIGEFTRAGIETGSPRQPGPDGYTFGPDRLRLFKPIEMNGERIGTIFIESDLRDIENRMVSYGTIAALVLVGALIAAWLFATVVQRRISRPILELADTSRVITHGHDFSVRARKTSEDELGQLADAFNDMLSEIHRRDVNLREANEAMARENAERKRAEQEIRRLNLGLEEKVRRRTAQLEAANEELEAFSYSVSHDLRAPLRGIDGFSQVLLEEYATKFDEEGKDYLRRVRASTQRMGQLIDDLLNLSRVSRTEMHRERVDLSAMASEIMEELLRTQPDRRVEFRCEPGAIADGDLRLLRIVLENLLGNALKYTSKHPAACIAFGVEHRDGSPVYYVSDDGAGFEMEYVTKLFGAFQRLHGPADFPGSGVGLATVQRIIHRHGGTIWARGEIEKGATFYFTLA